MMRDVFLVFCGAARVRVQRLCTYMLLTVKRWLLCFTTPNLELGLELLHIFYGFLHGKILYIFPVDSSNDDMLKVQ